MVIEGSSGALEEQEKNSTIKNDSNDNDNNINFKSGGVGGDESRATNKCDEKGVKTTKYYSACKHFRTPVKVGTGTIFVTAKSNVEEKEFFDNPPNLMIGLTDSWKYFLESPVKTSGIEEKIPKSVNVPYIIVDWSDRQACPKGVMEWLVDLTIKRIAKGQIIETGCQGGHGRTGTFLACLIGKVEKLDPNNAIEEVRKRFCEEAVESMAQIKQIYTFLGSIEQQAEEEWTVTNPASGWKKDMDMKICIMDGTEKTHKSWAEEDKRAMKFYGKKADDLSDAQYLEMLAHWKEEEEANEEIEDDIIAMKMFNKPVKELNDKEFMILCDSEYYT